MVEQLASKGFGLKEIRRLLNTIIEIAAANNIPEDKKFILDIEQQYDEKLGFESKIRVLREEIRKSEIERYYYSFATAFLNVVIKQQQDVIQKNGLLGEFGPLIKAARGETVSAEELRLAVVRALDLMISRIDPTGDLSTLLKASRLVLVEPNYFQQTKSKTREQPGDIV